MFFAVIGNNYELCQKEMQWLEPQNITLEGDHLICFDTNFQDRIPSIASFIKRWKILPFSQIETMFRENTEKRILGHADFNIGFWFKKKYKLKRFKQVELLHTDLEVKKKGIELVKIGKERGIVWWYQDIKLYETIDFDKPARSMKIGMMPAKLTHQLLNIALYYAQKKKKTEKENLIFDPFCGTGTTGILANALGYHFIGSDLEPSYAFKNESRWRQRREFYQEKVFSFFKQDATQPFSHEFQEMGKYYPIIVTEWWLGPIVTKTTDTLQIKEYQNQVKKVYVNFLQNIGKTFAEKPVIICSIPYYIGQENFLESEIKKQAEHYHWKVESVSDVYKRENQKVGRKILIFW